MKVLLVDDEMITLKMLQSLIPWKQMDLELMGMCTGGEEAYQMVLQETPDILITDIRMNGMGGLQLAEKVLAFSPQVKVILMSAYAEFSYVKEGIRMGCSNYILKPIDEDELEQSLRKVVGEIRGKQDEKKILNKSEAQIRMLELYRYMSRGNNLNRVLKHKNEYDFSFAEYAVMMIQKDSSSIDEYINVSNMEFMQEKYVLHIIEEILTHDYKKEFLAFDHEEDAWILIIRSDSVKEMLEISRQIVERFLTELHLNVLISFSQIGTCLEDLPQLYEQAESMRKYAFYIGEERILGYEWNCKDEEMKEVRKIGLLREAEQAVKLHDIANLQDIIEKVFELSLTYRPDVLHDTYEFCYQILYLLRRELENQEQIQTDDLKRLELSYEELKQHDSGKQLKQLMEDAVGLLQKICISESKEQFSKPVEDSLKFIEKNYNKNLSLDEISEEIAVSKNYFCYMFKREVGMSLWNYLTQIRIRHAKKLLEETDMKTYEIAFQVGYDNPSYFSKIFKKLESVTPNEYREKKK